jgi:hypothetical protein
VKNSPDIARPRSLQLLIGLFALLSYAQALAAPPKPTDPLSHQNYIRLKERFESLAPRFSDPAILTCLAVETTALAWTLAAARLTEDQARQVKWQTRAAEFEKSWSASRDWEARHRRALNVYYEAFSEVARQLAGPGQDGGQNADLRAVLDRTDRDMSFLDPRDPDAFLEKEALSRGLMGLGSIIIHSFGPEPSETAELILATVTEETRALSRRKDIHFRARLALIYAAQVQALTEILFLLGPAAGPPLHPALEEIKAALEKSGADPRLPTTLSLLWTAQAQASLPLAYWLSAKPDPDDDRDDEAP